MVDLVYVKKRKRRRLIEIITAVSAVVVTVFIILAFLGRNLGSFTVNLKSNSVELALSLTSSFEEPTTYLMVGNIEPMDTLCYSKIGHEPYLIKDIDSETTTYKKFALKDDKGNITSLPLFKYTFFIGNVGTTAARYDMKVNFTDIHVDSKTGKSLEDVLRMVIYEDGVPTDNTVYAKKSIHTHRDPDIPGSQTDQEYICGDPDSIVSKHLYAGLCTSFDGANLATISRNNFMGGDMRRYTILFWLEGHDAECEGYAPEDASLRIGVEIQAYEN